MEDGVVGGVRGEDVVVVGPRDARVEEVPVGPEDGWPTVTRRSGAGDEGEGFGWTRVGRGRDGGVKEDPRWTPEVRTSRDGPRSTLPVHRWVSLPTY